MGGSGNIPIFNIPGTLFWNFIENFSPIILGIYQGNVPKMFHEHIFAWCPKTYTKHTQTYSRT